MASPLKNYFSKPSQTFRQSLAKQTGVYKPPAESRRVSSGDVLVGTNEFGNVYMTPGGKTFSGGVGGSFGGTGTSTGGISAAAVAARREQEQHQRKVQEQQKALAKTQQDFEKAITVSIPDPQVREVASVVKRKIIDEKTGKKTILGSEYFRGGEKVSSRQIALEHLKEKIETENKAISEEHSVLQSKANAGELSEAEISSFKSRVNALDKDAESLSNKVDSFNRDVQVQAQQEYDRAMFQKGEPDKTPLENLFETPGEMVAAGATTWKKMTGQEPLQTEFLGIGKPSYNKMRLQTKGEQTLVGAADIGLSFIEPLFIPLRKGGVFVAETTGAKMPQIKGTFGETPLFDVGGTKKKTALFMGELFSLIGTPLAIGKGLKFASKRLPTTARVKQAGIAATEIDEASLTRGKFYGEGEISKPLFGTRKFEIIDVTAVESSKLKFPVLETIEREVAIAQTTAPSRPFVNILKIPKQHRPTFKPTTTRGLRAGARVEKGKLFQERAGFTGVSEPYFLEYGEMQLGDVRLIAQRTKGTGTIAGHYETYELGKKLDVGYGKKGVGEGFFGGRKAYDQKAILLEIEGDYLGFVKQKSKGVLGIETGVGLQSNVKTEIETLVGVVGKAKKPKPFFSVGGKTTIGTGTKTGKPATAKAVTKQKFGTAVKEINIAEEKALAQIAEEVVLFEKGVAKTTEKLVKKTKTGLRTGFATGTVFDVGTKQKQKNILKVETDLIHLPKMKQRTGVELQLETFTIQIPDTSVDTRTAVIDLTGTDTRVDYAVEHKTEPMLGLKTVTTTKPVAKTIEIPVLEIGYVPTPIPEIRIPPPLILLPTRTKSLPRMFTGFEPKKQTGYNAFIKRKGKFQKVTRKPLSKRGALGLGAFLTDKTASASFKVEKTNKRVKKRTNPTINWFKFRKPVKKGKPQTKSNNWIEKRKYRIDSKGEGKEITLKGLTALKKKYFREQGIKRKRPFKKPKKIKVFSNTKIKLFKGFKKKKGGLF